MAYPGAGGWGAPGGTGPVAAPHMASPMVPQSSPYPAAPKPLKSPQDVGPKRKRFLVNSKLFVGNLPDDVTDEEFRGLVSRYGEVDVCEINRSKRPCIGFVRFAYRHCAEEAKEQLHGFNMKGRSLIIGWAKPNATLNVSELSPFVTDELLHFAFSQFGEVEYASVNSEMGSRQSTCSGTVTFVNPRDAATALQACTDGMFLLTTTPCPVHVNQEPVETEGFSLQDLPSDNPVVAYELQYPPHFAQPGSAEVTLAQQWRDMLAEHQRLKMDLEQNFEEAKKKLRKEHTDLIQKQQAEHARQVAQGQRQVAMQQQMMQQAMMQQAAAAEFARQQMAGASLYPSAGVAPGYGAYPGVAPTPGAYGAPAPTGYGAPAASPAPAPAGGYSAVPPGGMYGGGTGYGAPTAGYPPAAAPASTAYGQPNPAAAYGQATPYGQPPAGAYPGASVPAPYPSATPQPTAYGQQPPNAGPWAQGASPQPPSAPFQYGQPYGR